jgi:Fe-S-cluster-containing dehydrogenase component
MGKENISEAEKTNQEPGKGLPAKAVSRREFLKVAGIGGLGVTSLYLLGCAKGNGATAAPIPARQVYVPHATMMILGDPTRCVGCRRCEIACTDYNEGKTQPSLARVKINRNYLFGPNGAQAGSWNGLGIFGNHRIIQDTCRQCPHPVPCLDACPYGAIEVVPPTNARVVNTQKCQGCKACQRACPWAMTTFDREANKASKCHLCAGDPQCVKACPTGALQYVPWTDRTKEVPARFIPVSAELPEDVKSTCAKCH